ncbi:MAG: hypothetical protein EOP29_08420 [Rhodococcus sp. (in: high G+C Gram-positive bacteria)]|nr:MAG: hypothetical protein EOP29_08420 [Rhodococcus sp. (in: high G+C Gram-positive bacteria)]
MHRTVHRPVRVTRRPRFRAAVPNTEVPSTEVPSTEDPSTEDPSTEDPSTEAPSTPVLPVGWIRALLTDGIPSPGNRSRTSRSSLPGC